ncbi:MAG: hypothetical protein ACRCYU_11975 [Nocardioides sp.]
MTTQTQARVQSGVPSGGEWTVGTRDEVDLPLVNEPSAEDREQEEVIRLLEAAYRAANQGVAANRAWHSSTAVEDAAQEAVTSLYERRANGRVIEAPASYVRRTAWLQARRDGSAARSEDRRAAKMLVAAREEKMQELGRELTGAEFQGLHDSIREHWHDPARRPSENYYNLTRPHFEFDLDKARTNPWPSTQQAAPGSYMDKALDGLEGTDGRNLADSRRMLYNALAEGAGAPLVAEGSLSQNRITAARATIESHDGGLDAAIDEAVEDRGSRAARAFLAPWESATEADKDRVLTMFERIPSGRREALWTSALQLANTRNVGRN